MTLWVGWWLFCCLTCAPAGSCIRPEAGQLRWSTAALLACLAVGWEARFLSMWPLILQWIRPASSKGSFLWWLPSLSCPVLVSVLTLPDRPHICLSWGGLGESWFTSAKRDQITKPEPLHTSAPMLWGSLSSVGLELVPRHLLSIEKGRFLGPNRLSLIRPCLCLGPDTARRPRGSHECVMFRFWRPPGLLVYLLFHSFTPQILIAYVGNIYPLGENHRRKATK